MKRRKGGEEMKRQWRRFLRKAKRERLYESELSYTRVPYFVRCLDRARRLRDDVEVEEILRYLKGKHGVTLNEKGELCFVRSDAVAYTDK